MKNTNTYFEPNQDFKTPSLVLALIVYLLYKIVKISYDNNGLTDIPICLKLPNC